MNYNKLFDYQEEYFKKLNSIRFAWGSISKIDFIELHKLVKKHKRKDMRIADVGCWIGISTIALATIAKSVKGKVFAVDWFKGSLEANIEECGYYYNIRNIFEENIKKHNLEKYIEIIQKPSIEGSMEFLDNSLDFIFIDADHRYSKFKNDLKVWYPKLKKGGILAGHDYDIHPGIVYEEQDCVSIHIGIIQALHEKFGTKNIKIAGKSKIWYKKKES